MISRFLLLLQVSRPLTWPLLPLVYCLGMQAAHASLSAVAVTQIALLTFPMNLIGCGLNDIFDYESDQRSARRRIVWNTPLAPADRAFVWSWCVAMMPIVVLGGCLARNTDSFVTTVSLVLLAWLYSVPPVRLKERPPLDSVANGLGYFLVPFAMGYSLGADIRTMSSRYLFLTLCVCGVHSLASAVDYDADRSAGHRTIATVAGPRVAAGLCFAAFFVTWWRIEFNTPAVFAYIVMCTIVAFVAMLVPKQRVLLAACIAICGGFVVAAAIDLAGI